MGGNKCKMKTIRRKKRIDEVRQLVKTTGQDNTRYVCAWVCTRVRQQFGGLGRYIQGLLPYKYKKECSSTALKGSRSNQEREGGQTAIVEQAWRKKKEGDVFQKARLCCVVGRLVRVRVCWFYSTWRRKV